MRKRCTSLTDLMKRVNPNFLFRQTGPGASDVFDYFKSTQDPAASYDFVDAGLIIHYFKMTDIFRLLEHIHEKMAQGAFLTLSADTQMEEKNEERFFFTEMNGELMIRYFSRNLLMSILSEFFGFKVCCIQKDLMKTLKGHVMPIIWVIAQKEGPINREKLDFSREKYAEREQDFRRRHAQQKTRS